MTAVGLAGYGIAGFSYLFLAVLLALSWRGRRIGVRLIVASAATSLWAFVLVLESRITHMPLLVVYLAEVTRDAAWLLLLTELAKTTAPRILITGTHVLWIGLLLLGIALPVVPALGISIDTPSLLLSRAGLALALCGLVLLEQIYRNASAAGRKSLSYLVAGVGTLFAYDLFLYSQ
ncbi:MAG TPA: hypothetical protein VKB34_13845, partial [Povalibacter sp.]|nr:hypothetical protein [Povalibacter sp.]